MIDGAGQVGQDWGTGKEKAKRQFRTWVHLIFLRPTSACAPHRSGAWQVTWAVRPLACILDSGLHGSSVEAVHGRW